MKNQLKTIALLGALAVAFVSIGSLLGEMYAYGALVFALALNAGAYFFSDRVVLALHHAVEIDRAKAPVLHRMVGELAAAAHIPKPRLFIIHDSVPNAFATGRSPRHGVVAITDGILDFLDERELRAVLAHEVAHIKNRDALLATIATAIAAAITYVAYAAHFFALFGERQDEDAPTSPLSWFLTILVAPIAATLIQLGISRSREYLADEEGARISGDPAALADALTRLEYGVARFAHHAEPATASLFIVSPFAGGSVPLASLFSTHPSTEERVRRLRAMVGLSTTRLARNALVH